MSLHVKDVMVADVAFVGIPGNRDDVLRVLQERRVSGLPVVKKGEVVGMITRNDLLRNREEEQTALLMSRDPVIVSPGEDVIEAAKLMLKHDKRRLPVVEDRKLVGIITVADIVKVIAEMGLVESIGPYFEREMLVLWSEMPLPVAGAVMEYSAAEACPVLDTALTLVGMISDRDLIKASVIEDTVEKTDMSADAGEDAWMWDRVMQTINKYYSVSRIELKAILVREAMIAAITATKNNTVSECAAIMHKNRIDQLPVVTPSQKLTGLLRDKDILRALVDHSEQKSA